MHIDSIGNVAACPFIPKDLTFGNVKDEPLETIWSSKQANITRKKLKSFPMCKKCTSVVDLFSLVREEFFNFMSFLVTNPRRFSKKVKNYIGRNTTQGQRIKVKG